MNHADKYFALNNLAIEAAIRSVEDQLDIDLGHRDPMSTASVSDRGVEGVEQTYYPQFSEALRLEAERMARNYVLFYSLENAVRDLICDVLEEAHGKEWWEEDGVVPEPTFKNANGNRRKEIGAGVTLRSDRMIDYTNFGELGEIIKINWDQFGAIFADKRAVERIFNNLNTLRASIAHCTALSEDEELRLHLSLRDWFRQQA